MTKILFFDQSNYKEYDPETLLNDPLGGTEATIVRIAEGLAALKLFDVYVMQKHRTIPKTFGASYVPQNTDFGRFDYVITLRSLDAAFEAKLLFPLAKHYLWMHDLGNINLIPGHRLIQALNTEIVSVSKFHKKNLEEYLLKGGYQRDYPIHTIYNPIADDLDVNKDVLVNPYKLFWASSPHKGLQHALEIFKQLKKIKPDFELYVANPGYFESKEIDIPGVKVLGKLVHHQVLQHMRTSLCVFYPNYVYPETFGLVMAEANAVGTPVLTHDIGAASEVTSSFKEIEECNNMAAVINKVISWSEGERPFVRGKSEFRLANILKSWIKLFK